MAASGAKLEVLDTHVPLTSSTGTGNEAGRVEERTILASIYSIKRDMDSLQNSVPLASGVTGSATCFSVGAASLATVASTFPAWGSLLIPVLVSGLFVVTSMAESSSARSVGLARNNSGEALLLAAKQEAILAKAAVPKAYLPFSVGLTAVFAAGCVTVKVIDETTTVLQNGSAFLVLLALSSAVGAVMTSDQCICLQEALKISTKDDEWEALPPEEARVPDPAWRAVVAGLALLFCLLPVFLFPTLLQQGSLQQTTVIVSATAAAWSALTLLVAEKDFADAERRIAIQCKDAALAELFTSQVEADAALLPVGSAVSGAALGGTLLGVEFSNAVALLPAWPAMVTSIRSIVASVRARLEAAASYLELQDSRKGLSMPEFSDSLTSSLRELDRLLTESRRNQFSDDIRKRLQELPVDRSYEFSPQTRRQRRQIHLIAAELGMVSQSSGTPLKRIVTVTNIGRTAIDEEDEFEEVKEIWAGVQEDLYETVSGGVPTQLRLQALLVTALTLAGCVSPVLLVRNVAELVVPLVTGTVGLGTFWQETAGKEEVATAKQQTALLLQRRSTGAVLIGRATMCYGALPTAFAVSTLALSLAVIGSVCSARLWVQCAALPAFLVVLLAWAVSWQRCGRVERFIASTLSYVNGPDYPLRLRSPRNWLLAPAVAALLVPCHLPQRLLMAAAILAGEVGVLMALAAHRIAKGTYYFSCCSMIWASADAGSAQAEMAIRALPLKSAIATAGALLSTAVAPFSLPLSLAFPVANLAAWIRAAQFRAEAQEKSAQVRRQCAVPLESGSRALWGLQQNKRPPAGHTAVEPAADTAEVRNLLLPQTVSAVMAQELRSTGRRARAGATSLPRAAMAALLRAWQVRMPEEEYAQSPVELAVESIQADINEARVSVRSNRRRWYRAVYALTLGATTAVSLPYLLPELVTEVALPVVGAALPIAVSLAETDTRASVAIAKVETAELSLSVARMEQLVSASVPQRARLMAVAALSCGAAAVVQAMEHPLHPGFEPLRGGAQRLLVLAQVLLSAWSVRPLREVHRLAARAKEVAAPQRAPARSPAAPDFPLRLLPAPAGRDRTRWLSLELLAGVLPAVLAVLPWGRSLAKRAVVSGAAASFVLTLALLSIEMTFASAELAMAQRARATALTDAFGCEAEHQGALLPLASAATIAFSGLITFGTELNPSAASVIVFLQVATWVIASRKAAAAKFESSAALLVKSTLQASSPKPSKRPARSGSGQPDE